MVSDERGSTGGQAGSAPGDELGDPVALRCTLHIPASHLHAHTHNVCSRARPGTAARCLPLLDTSAGTPARPLTARRVSSHVAPKQLQLQIWKSEWQREQGARRDGLGQRCRTAGNRSLLDPAMAPASCDLSLFGLCPTLPDMGPVQPEYLQTLRSSGTAAGLCVSQGRGFFWTQGKTSEDGRGQPRWSWCMGKVFQDSH